MSSEFTSTAPPAEAQAMRSGQAPAGADLSPASVYASNPGNVTAIADIKAAGAGTPLPPETNGLVLVDKGQVVAGGEPRTVANAAESAKPGDTPEAAAGSNALLTEGKGPPVAEAKALGETKASSGATGADLTEAKALPRTMENGLNDAKALLGFLAAGVRDAPGSIAAVASDIAHGRSTIAEDGFAVMEAGALTGVAASAVILAGVESPFVVAALLGGAVVAAGGEVVMFE
jgi:hypothetical protein